MCVLSGAYLAVLGSSCLVSGDLQFVDFDLQLEYLGLLVGSIRKVVLHVQVKPAGADPLLLCVE